MVGPEEDEEKEVEEFESVEDEEEERQPIEEFETFDDSPPEDIKGSGFKTTGGQIPGYEPTLDEVLSYAMGRTKDPTEPAPEGKGDVPKDGAPGSPEVGSPAEEEEVGEEGEVEEEEGVGEENPSEDDVEMKDGLGDIFDDDEEEPE